MIDQTLIPESVWINPLTTDAKFEENRVFFVTVFGRLKETGKSRSGEPIMRRSTRVWAWFSKFEDAARTIIYNETDIHETMYEYAMVEAVPEGMLPLRYQEWWWKWDNEQERYLPSSRPADYENVVSLSIG